jgi:hypothetical protein|tara:strand:- start:305 stop:676 length:372 start_codon:yes stop_codon:yes gene_type:complete
MATPKKLDTSVFDKAVAKATQQLVNRLSAEYTSEISSDKWNWVDGRTRDIVDTGRLRASQTVRRVSDTEFEFSWPVEYAAQVHEGTKLKGGGEWPARPWTRTALENVDAKSYFETILRRELSG